MRHESGGVMREPWKIVGHGGDRPPDGTWWEHGGDRPLMNMLLVVADLWAGAECWVRVQECAANRTGDRGKFGCFGMKSSNCNF